MTNRQKARGEVGPDRAAQLLQMQMTSHRFSECNSARVGGLCLILMSASGAPIGSNRALHGVDMMGECAVVAHHDSWKDEATGQV